MYAFSPSGRVVREHYSTDATGSALAPAGRSGIRAQAERDERAVREGRMDASVFLQLYGRQPRRS